MMPTRKEPILFNAVVGLVLIAVGIGVSLVNNLDMDCREGIYNMDEYKSVVCSENATLDRKYHLNDSNWVICTCR